MKERKLLQSEVCKHLSLAWNHLAYGLTASVQLLLTLAIEVTTWLRDEVLDSHPRVQELDKEAA